jgi:DNA (cytosine-5)-methyltransferase 1
MKTYISLFSSAGVGCYAFKTNGFECVATNEIIEKRLNIQRINHKCKYDSGYINGDITKTETQDKIFAEIIKWKKLDSLKDVDVIIATPPCQGMSTANYKKGDEIERNSLVVEAIHLIKKIKPRVFIFENVRAFLNTMCVDKDDQIFGIDECINKHLEAEYYFYSKVINFQDYGVPSSRPRTIVIGTRRDETNFSPLNIFPLKQKSITVREAIGDLKQLNFGDIDPNDFYHSFRIYPKYMQNWIHELKEGESAFNNTPEQIPFKVVLGKRQILKSGHMGNKFRRIIWDRPAPCITTRNDQLASQSTIHPKDDRVLSIRELMLLMTIPKSFKWVSHETKENINSSEPLIRKSIGEAVPTSIFNQISENISTVLEYDEFLKNYPNKIEKKEPNSKNFYINSFIHENLLQNVNENGEFFTPQIVVYHTIKNLNRKQQNLNILEPSVGLGAFIPQLLRLIDDCEFIELDLLDISNESIINLKQLIKFLKINSKIKINYIIDDFLTHKFTKKYDVIISNPPYFKISPILRKKYKFLNLKSDNIFNLFLYKFSDLSDEILTVIPKNFLMIPDSNQCRELFQNKYKVKSIYDYGVKYFKLVFIEIISIHFIKGNVETTLIVNLRDKTSRYVKWDYIYHTKAWLIYRDSWFDNYISSLQLDVFEFYRDRQLTNRFLSTSPKKIWVLRSKNLDEYGNLVHIEGYDKYIDSLSGFYLEKFQKSEQIIFTNFTYNTRATILPKTSTVNGSFCILLPKIFINNINLSIYSSREFRLYYAIVKNLSKFTINVDSNSIYYIGIKKNV